jgi:hypothetical protein
MASETPAAQALPEKGDLFVCEAVNGAFLVVSMKFADVNLVGKDELCAWTRLKLRLCRDPDTKVLFVRHYKRCYAHMKPDHPDYARLKPSPPPRPTQTFDARELVKVGDVFEEHCTYDSQFPNRTATATKVTKCFVTIDGGKYVAGRHKVSLRLGGGGPQLFFHSSFWRLR